MIGSLRGVVLERASSGASTEVVIEVGGVGYRVLVPTGTATLADPGAALFVHVHTHVREDAIILYGFATRDERRCFETLIGVHGVGPALALAVLSTHGPADLQRIVATEDASALALVPGVGRKTALRLLLDLQAKFDVLDATGDGFGSATVATSGSGGAPLDALGEVRAALAGLGYGVDEIREAVRDLPAGAGVPELLRLALRQLAGAR